MTGGSPGFGGQRLLVPPVPLRSLAGASGDTPTPELAFARQATKGWPALRKPKARGGGPGRIRTCDNTVMSGGF